MTTQVHFDAYSLWETTFKIPCCGIKTRACFALRRDVGQIDIYRCCLPAYGSIGIPCDLYPRMDGCRGLFFLLQSDMFSFIYPMDPSFTIYSLLSPLGFPLLIFDGLIRVSVALCFAIPSQFQWPGTKHTSLKLKAVACNTPNNKKTMGHGGMFAVVHMCVLTRGWLFER